MLDVEHIAAKYRKSESIAIRSLATGNIQDTYLISEGTADPGFQFILQKLNTSIFPNPANLIDNHQRLEQHLADKGRVLIIPGLLQNENGSMLLHQESAAWRAQEYILQSITIERVEHENLAYEGANMIGRFTASFIDLDPTSLHTIIPGFHNLNKYLEAFFPAIENDVVGRRSLCEKEIDMIVKLASKMKGMFEATRRLPDRVCHSDTKISNILFDENSKKAIKVIDLDTTMPEKVIFDFGDMMRTFSCLADENEEDLSKITVRPEIFESMTKGYLHETKDLLSDAEKSELYNGGLLITYEQAVRFLNDYLRNDAYYHTNYPHHNLVRAKNQLKLLDQLFIRENEFKSIIEKYS